MIGAIFFIVIYLLGATGTYHIYQGYIADKYQREWDKLKPEQVYDTGHYVVSYVGAAFWFIFLPVVLIFWGVESLP